MAIVGIDLGTTNSLIGRIEKGRPRLFEDDNNSPLIPSVISVDGSSLLVGHKAKARKQSHPKDTLFSAKRFLGKNIEDVKEWISILPFDFSPSDLRAVRFKLGDKVVTPIDVSTAILKKLKQVAETATSDSVTQAVITVPAYFNDSQRQATKLAGEMAGLEVLRIVNEPTAACLAYGLDKKTQGTIAVFDLGGGTFDISILKVRDGVFEVLATNGDTSLGGDDFDHAIAFALRLEIQRAIRVDPYGSPEHRALLIHACEKLKKDLSEVEWVNFSLSFGEKNFERKIYRTEIEKWCMPVLRRAEAPVQQCLKDARLKVSDLTDVLLVGGSTLFPLVKSFCKDLFRRDPICSLNPEEVVAMGATVQANVLAGARGDILLLDVIPLSLGLETMGGVVSKLIHRNSTIPVSATDYFTTYVDGQTSVDIHVVQGERELTKDNRSLARFQLKGIPPLPAGIPKLEVQFIIDANGILSVKALEQRTGTSASITVNPTYGLTDNEVERMLTEAFEFAETDYEARFLSEAKVEAESLIRATEKSLERGKDLLEPGEKEAIQSCIAELQIVASNTERKPIRETIEKLNTLTRPLAERIMNQAVSEALRHKTVPSIGEGK